MSFSVYKGLYTYSGTPTGDAAIALEANTHSIADRLTTLEAGGTSGFSGYSGAGTSGYSGYSGAGTSGYSGYSGAGTSGYSGYSGAGTSGYSGYSGAGTSGFSGYSGQAGVGQSGASGFSGTSGRSGYSGFSGVGTSGFSGFSGTSGRSGWSGQAGSVSSTPSFTSITLTGDGGGLTTTLASNGVLHATTYIANQASSFPGLQVLQNEAQDNNIVEIIDAFSNVVFWIDATGTTFATLG